jgi:hypothetical protein
MRHISHNLLIFAAVGALSISLGGCITEYNPPLGDFAELLVVEGIITDGETTIHLSRSTGIYNDPLSTTEYVDPTIYDAQVWVESEDGKRFDVDYSTSGYVIRMGDLDESTRYRLCITWEGEDYASDWRSPQRTPPIENVYFHQEYFGAPVEVRLDVAGESGDSGYYFWRYEEEWEIRASINASHYFSSSEGNYTSMSLGLYLDSNSDDDPTNDLSSFKYPGHVSPFYYCWKYGRSRELLLATTEHLTENKLRGRVLYEIDSQNDRLSYLYHTRILQYSIGSDAYYYYSNQKKNSDDTGSIFSPIPSEMVGNISCLTSPDIPVIGFVEVSRGSTREEYLDGRPFYTYRDECVILTSDKAIEDAGYSVYSFYPIVYDPMMAPEFTTIDCIDCRRMGGSKSRPSWWPNDHQ